MNSRPLLCDFSHAAAWPLVVPGMLMVSYRNGGVDGDTQQNVQNVRPACRRSKPESGDLAGWACEVIVVCGPTKTANEPVVPSQGSKPGVPVRAQAGSTPARCDFSHAVALPYYAVAPGLLTISSRNVERRPRGRAAAFSTVRWRRESAEAGHGWHDLGKVLEIAGGGLASNGRRPKQPAMDRARTQGELDGEATPHHRFSTCDDSVAKVRRTGPTHGRTPCGTLSNRATDNMAGVIAFFFRPCRSLPCRESSVGPFCFPRQRRLIMYAKTARRLKVGDHVVVAFSTSHRRAEIIQITWPIFLVTTTIASGERRTQWNRYRALFLPAEYERLYGKSNRTSPAKEK